MAESKKFIEILKEIDGLVLAVLGFMILWAFAALGIHIPFIWNAALVAIIIIFVIVYYVYIKKDRD